MTKTPRVLPETPQASSDLLSDLLGSMHLTGTVLFRAEFREPWLVDTPDCGQLARMLPFRTEHIVPFHVIATGGCWLQLRELDRVWLGEGDAVLLPYGDNHRLGGRGATTPQHIGALLPRPPWSNILVVEHGGPGAATSIVCGLVQCDELLFHPILHHLPPVLHVRSDGGAGDNWLTNTIRHTAAEATRPMPGSRSMLPRLTELMFVEILRMHMQGLSAEAVGWFAAWNDPVAGAALKLLHAAPLRDWSVEELARAAGTSKTVLAERFKHYLEQPPIQYLAGWRMKMAAQHLKSTELPVKTIADHSGYESEAAFSRAFKRHFGSSPADWRKRQTQS